MERDMRNEKVTQPLKGKVCSYFLIFIIVSCASVRHPSYWLASHHSFIDGKHEIRVQKSSSYCPVRDSEGKHKKNIEGKLLYHDSCGTKKPIFRDFNNAAQQGEKMVREMCGGVSKYVGKRPNKTYIGTTSVSCYSRSSYSSSYYGNSLYGRGSTSCYGGNPIYDYSMSYFFQCSDFKSECDGEICLDVITLESQRWNEETPTRQRSCIKNHVMGDICGGV